MELAVSPSIGASASQLFLGERKTVGFTVGTSDLGKNFVCGSAITIALSAGSTLGNGFYFFVTHETSGSITIDPNGVETISFGPNGSGATTGAQTYVLKQTGETAMFLCIQGIGATWDWVVFPGANTWNYLNILTEITTPIDADSLYVGSLANLDMRRITRSSFLKQPSFALNKGGVDQTGLNTAAYTKITYTGVTYDTYSYVSSGRYTPLVAGKYLTFSSAEVNNIGDTQYANSSIWKNGALYARGRAFATDATGDVIPHVVSLIDMNGTTDYIEHYVYHTKGSDATVAGDIEATYFSACRISS